MRISDWKDTRGTGWTGYIEKSKWGYSGVLHEGFGTYETLEEAEAYMVENDYEKVK